jgi:hypothetical protein
MDADNKGMVLFGEFSVWYIAKAAAGFTLLSDIIDTAADASVQRTFASEHAAAPSGSAPLTAALYAAATIPLSDVSPGPLSTTDADHLLPHVQVALPVGAAEGTRIVFDNDGGVHDEQLQHRHSSTVPNTPLPVSLSPRSLTLEMTGQTVDRVSECWVPYCPLNSHACSLSLSCFQIVQLVAARIASMAASQRVEPDTVVASPAAVVPEQSMSVAAAAAAAAAAVVSRVVSNVASRFMTMQSVSRSVMSSILAGVCAFLTDMAVMRGCAFLMIEL